MGFLGQELPGSIICDECTCSHMPMYNRSRTYLRLHVFVHPPLGTRSLWVNAHRSLPPAGCGTLPRNGLLGATGSRPGHKIPVRATPMVSGRRSCMCKMQPGCAQPPWMGGNMSPRFFLVRSHIWPAASAAQR